MKMKTQMKSVVLFALGAGITHASCLATTIYRFPEDTTGESHMTIKTYAPAVISNTCTSAATWTRQLRDSTGAADMPVDGVNLIWDGGEYGAWTVNTTSYRLMQAYMSHVVLGGNHANACVFSGDGVYLPSNSISKDGITNNVFYTKRDSGTWRLTDEKRSNLRGGWAIEEGILEVPSVAERGVACSMGTAIQVAEPYHTCWNDERAVGYAIRLGAGDEKIGTLKYTGDADLVCATRPIVVNGSGRFENGTAHDIHYANFSSFGDGVASLILAGDDPAAKNVLSNVNDGASAGSLKIVKEGAGTWILNGELGFSGGVEVKDGQLVVNNIQNYNWFKFRVVENHGGRIGATSEYNTLAYLLEMGLFDANGNRVNAGLSEGAASDLKEGEACRTRGRSHSSNPFTYMLDGDKDTCGSLQTPLQSGSTPYPNITKDDEKTQPEMVMHLSHNVARVTGFDWIAKYGLSNARSNAVMHAWKVFGSFDGEEWQEIGSDDDCPCKTSAWSYGGGDMANPNVNAKALDYTIPEGKTFSVLPNGLSCVKVAQGGTFKVQGKRLSIQRLEVVVEGMGRLENVSFATEGVLDVVGKVHGLATIELDLKDCTGIENLQRWVARLNGRVSDRIEVDVENRVLKVLQSGLIMVVR